VALTLVAPVPLDLARLFVESGVPLPEGLLLEE
jgi:hypothetical protein